jgi:dienelactone hydrolase
MILPKVAVRTFVSTHSNQKKVPGIIVVHENRGLNPYIEDVGRRAAVDGFITLAPDALSPLGGYPGNDDAGRELQKNELGGNARGLHCTTT